MSDMTFAEARAIAEVSIGHMNRLEEDEAVTWHLATVDRNEHPDDPDVFIFGLTVPGKLGEEEEDAPDN